ncbi:MAG TPA: DNA polymerase III subunit gamma/tau, partial [Pirellulaceae bacterium]|nr:DNA polymerase III subunit gamma/tau [Pirellulaceae bacterium]
ARFKIYIIDEVHMLTKEAFNALLKTLEEPPEHVKFVLCTTDPEKIPITVLSRCQRFDFAPVATNEIQQRLSEIAQNEGVSAEPAALQLVARRAAGSMRDSQSLLEQLLSVCEGSITVAAVNRMLGTAQSGRLGELVAAIAARNPSESLSCIDGALRERADVGQLAEQLLEQLRDMLAASIGASRDILLASSPDAYDELASAGKQLGAETLLAMLQILDHALVRMRQSMHPRVLLEVAVVRMCQLEALDELSTLLNQLQGIGPPATSGAPINRSPVAHGNNAVASPARSISPAAGPVGGNVPQVPAAQKKTELTTPEVAEPPTRVSPAAHLTAKNASEVWQQVVEALGDMTGDMARLATQVASSGPNRLVVQVPAAYIKEHCERPNIRSRIEQALNSIVGQPVKVDFEVRAEAAPRPVQAAVSAPNKRQMMKDRERNVLVQQTIELFQAEMVEVIEPRR